MSDEFSSDQAHALADHASHASHYPAGWVLFGGVIVALIAVVLRC